MTRLDQLAKPRKRHDLPSLDERNSLPVSKPLSYSSKTSSVTRSMSHLAVGKKPSRTGSTTNAVPLNKNDSRSMHHLASVGVHTVPRATLTTQLREQKLLGSTTNNSSEGMSSTTRSSRGVGTFFCQHWIIHFTKSYLISSYIFWRWGYLFDTLKFKFVNFFASLYLTSRFYPN